ncbi:hypothetical protein ACFLQR_05005, partial [Verrucomicrobiota bacterium]
MTAILIWWSPLFPYRIPVSVHADKATAYDIPVEVAVNFTEELKDLGKSGASLDSNSVRVVEYSPEGKVISGEHGIPCQFEPGKTFDQATNAVGKAVWIAEGKANGPKDRSFAIYFDIVGGKPKPKPDFKGLVIIALESLDAVCTTTYGKFDLVPGTYRDKGGCRNLKTPEGEGVGAFLAPRVKFGWVGVPGKGTYGGSPPKISQLQLLHQGPVRAIYGGDPKDGYEYIIYYRGGAMVRQRLTGREKDLSTYCNTVFGRGTIESGGSCYFTSDGDYVPTQFSAGKKHKISG